MYSMDDVRKWKAVYRLLNQVETEVYDCGTLCGSACCSCGKGDGEDPAELGIYLFPGEHLLLQEICQKEICRPENRMENRMENLMWESTQEMPGTEELQLEEESRRVPDRYQLNDWLEWSTQDPAELGFPESWTEPVYFLNCRTAPSCPRHLRPLQCRTFPLKPVIGENGVLEMIWNDEELPYKCPIIEQNLPIHDDFYKATYTVWTHLIRDPRIFDLVMSWS